MVIIPALKMVKYGGWFMALFYPHELFPVCIPFAIQYAIHCIYLTSMIQGPRPMPYAYGVSGGSQVSLVGSAQHQRPRTTKYCLKISWKCCHNTRNEMMATKLRPAITNDRQMGRNVITAMTPKTPSWNDLRCPNTKDIMRILFHCACGIAATLSRIPIWERINAQIHKEIYVRFFKISQNYYWKRYEKEKPLVPHEAVAEASKIRRYKKGELLWCPTTYAQACA